MKTHERLQAIIDHIDTISFYCEQCDITTLGNFVANPMAMDACITHIGHMDLYRPCTDIDYVEYYVGF